MDRKCATPHATSTLQGRERREIELSCIHEIAKILTTASAPEQAATRVVGVLSESLGLREATVVLFGKQGQPELVVSSGQGERIGSAFGDHPAQRAASEIMFTKEPLVIRNIEKSPLFKYCDFAGSGYGAESYYSLVGVPVKIKNRVLGALLLVRVPTIVASVFHRRDVRMLEIVACHIATAVTLPISGGNGVNNSSASPTLTRKRTDVLPASEGYPGKHLDILGKSQPIPGRAPEVDDRKHRGPNVYLGNKHNGTKDKCVEHSESKPTAMKNSTDFVSGAEIASPEGFVDQRVFESKYRKDTLINAMVEAGWVKARAARLLGLTVRQVGYALKKHEIPIRKI